LLSESLDEDPEAWLKQWELNALWSPEWAAMRRDPRLSELARRIGLLDYWKQYGFPDGCSPGNGAEVTCS